MEVDPALWRDLAPDDVKGDEDLMRVITNSQEPDLHAVIKSFAHYERNKGSSVKMPGKDALPEELMQFKGKMAEAGIIALAPQSGAHYTVASMDGLDADVLTAFREVAHSTGITQKQFEKLLEFDIKRMDGINKSLKTDSDATTAALKTEWGDKFDANSELAGRAGAAIFKTEEEMAFFDSSGINNHPTFVKVMARMGAMMQEDPTLLPKTEGGVGEEFMKEALDIMQNAQNPKNERYLRGEGNILAEVTELFRKAKGTKPVDFA